MLAHFAEDATFSSPVAARVVPGSGGVLRGKAAIRDYWTTALRGLPDLRFEVLGTYAGGDTLVINYRNQRGGLVSEVLTFDDGVVVQGRGTYLAAAATDVGAMDRPELTLAGERVTLVPVRGEHVDDLRRIRRTPDVESRWGVETYEPPWPFDDPAATVFTVLVERRGARADPVRRGGCAGLPAREHRPVPRPGGPRPRRRAGRGAGHGPAPDRGPGHHRITIDPAADNHPAIRCYAAVGFRPVGRACAATSGTSTARGWHDGLLMDLLAEDFRPA